jgi:hypothetical protein
VTLEPFGEDFTLRPKEMLTFVPIAPGPDFYFHCAAGEPGFVALWREGHEKGVAVYTEDTVQVNCGYQRELSPSQWLRDRAPGSR